MKAFPVFNVLETVTEAAECKLIKFFLLAIAQIACYNTIQYNTIVY